MKKISAPILLLVFGFIPIKAQESLPPINQGIIKYVQSVIGKSVGHGECWDLADEALTRNNAVFDKTSQKSIYIFGKLYNPGKDKILPGDIIQFENVAVSYEKGNAIYKEEYPHHTAIVYEVINDHQVRLAHQNTGFSGKKVGISDFDLTTIKKGKTFFYHPIAQ